MNRIDNKKVSEITEELQISSRTVEKQISIALKKTQDRTSRLFNRLIHHLPATILNK